MVKSQLLDRTFAALSDPTRRDILEQLSAGPASISELARPSGISLPGVMKHVRVLEAASLVTTEKHGRVRQCRLGPGGMDDATRWIESHRRQWERRLDRLETIVARKTRPAMRKGDLP
ncbi:MAG TPA: metalloregulator ArsR/SmtB family transcription factor [Actinomycetota bacterium]|nr:metalloregulator ArsR/SmtB family transcription factor [Actinomycetota bacterium]